MLPHGGSPSSLRPFAHLETITRISFAEYSKKAFQQLMYGSRTSLLFRFSVFGRWDCFVLHFLVNRVLEVQYCVSFLKFTFFSTLHFKTDFVRKPKAFRLGSLPHISNNGFFLGSLYAFCHLVWGLFFVFLWFFVPHFLYI